MNLKQLSVFLSLTALTLVGCGQTSSSSDESQAGSSEALIENANLLSPTDYDFTYRQVRTAEGYSSVMPSTGDVNILVIPVQFTDFPCADLDGGCEIARENINTALFGDGTGMDWESLHSFYEKSSYGKLNITGTVSDWYTAEMTAVDLANNAADNPVSSLVARKAMTWYKSVTGDNCTQFDSDHDGFVDALWLVYSVPYHPQTEGMPEDSSVFWAFTAYYYGSQNVNNPSFFQYAWASYDFLFEDGYYDRDADGYLIRDSEGNGTFHNWVDDQGKVLLDAHTFIHETGHLMGLEDYYTYDSPDWGAAGAVDMMDYNVGDHNGYSKSLYGWSDVQVVTGSTKVTLSPYESSGQVLMLTPNYTNTLCDEYLLLEFYTPTGLNYFDSVNAFAGYYPKTFSLPGIKVYHVDSRVGRFKKTANGYVFSNYTTVLANATSTAYVSVAASNTASRSASPDVKLLHLLESSGDNTFKHGGIATDDTLFVEGDSFGYDTFTDYTFNDGLALGYRFKVTAVTAEGATLEIYKIPAETVVSTSSGSVA